MSEKQERPVLTGLIALVAVAVVVGLLMGGAALFGTKILGLDGGGDATGAATKGDSLYLPTPSPTKAAGGQITLAPGDPTPSSSAPAEENTKKPERKIQLVAGQQSVGSFDEIDLTGTYPMGNGKILQVQRFEGGSWREFPVTMTVQGGTFSTFVQTGVSGMNKFRVIDTDTDTKSNSVMVKVG
ncbi:conserved exported hypothetical protein [metagenome]|uniref:Uncharacterized protein n=1 Tax=metagenome TaxID=256318 RepID=A0A2P2BZT7_9ZZZZ